MMKVTVFIACYCVFSGIVAVQSCTYLYTSDDGSDTFDSHFLYGVFDYSPYEDNCWIIEAPYDKVVYLESESFDLENYCPDPYSGDRVNIYDGDSSFDSLDMTVCGSEGIYNYVSSGRYVYVEFITDDNVEASGFRITYKSVDESYYDDVSEGLAVAVIVGIVIGSLVGLALLIGIIVCCVVCVTAMKKKGGKVHNATNAGQPTVYNNQAYYPRQQQPQQQQQYGYPTAGHTHGTTMEAAAQATNAVHNKAIPPVPPVQSHPIDANGIPMPAIYTEPRTSSI